MAKLLLSRYTNELKTFRKYFEKAQLNQSPDHIHELRVSIKKLRVFNNIIWPLVDKPGNVRFLHQFDDLFKNAGRVREAHVNCQLASSEDKNYLKSYLAFQKRTDAGNRKALKNELENFNLDHLKKLQRVVGTSLRTVPEKKQIQIALNYLSISLNQINRLLKLDHNDKLLHSIRKHVREANETLKLIRSHHLPVGLRKLNSELKEIQLRIGNWHDQVVLVKSISHFVESQPSGIKSNQLEQLLKRLEHQASNTRENLFKSLEEVFPGLIKQSGIKV